MGISPIGSTVSESMRRHAEQDPDYRAELERIWPYEQVARQIIRLRMDHDLSQQALAQRIGTTKSAISRLESGQHAPNVATLQKIAVAFSRQLQISFDDPVDVSRKVAAGAGR
ncbi:MAG TPA: helix-turn-helix transcriptional regulator [Acidimicrobiales bacterium]|nr:helix-turn-helix transcriptional regulator [Acidimicrobiales bacterium]